MEPIRLTGKERYDWERAAIARQTRSRQLVLRVLLDYAGGKAECWPCNATIGKAIGILPRAVQLHLRSLEDAGAIRCIPDGTLFARRRIVLLGHPGTREALKRKQGASSDGYGVGSSDVPRSEQPGTRAQVPPPEPPEENHEINFVVGRSADEPPPDHEASDRLAHFFRRWFPNAGHEENP